jgi:hypothetical protein
MTRYGFSQAMGAFFHVDGLAADKLVPEGLSAVEAHPGLAVAAVTAFDFTETEVGAYGELVLSLLVVPFATAGETLPLAAYFPFALATSTDASRAHATERWRLPQFAHCLHITFDESADGDQLLVRDGDEPVLTLTVGHTNSESGSRLYQCFSLDTGGLHRVNIEIHGAFDEHEEELGVLELGTHALTTDLANMLEDEVPFREQLMRAGEQRFGLLTPHGRIPA